jgi:hypothetical protein
MDLSGTSLDKLGGSEHTDPMSSPSSFDMHSAWAQAKEPYEEIALEVRMESGFDVIFCCAPYTWFLTLHVLHRDVDNSSLVHA